MGVKGMRTEFSNASVCYPVCNASKLGRGSRLAAVMLPLKLKLTRSNSNPCHRVAAQVFEQALALGQPGLTRQRS